jgi:hypothetical protein
LKIVIESYPALAHPTLLLSRITDKQGMIRDILCDYGARANKGISADGVAADYSAVCSKGSALLNKCGAELIHLPKLCTGIIYISKDHGRAAEDTIFQCHTLIYAYIILELAIVSYGNIRPNHHVLSNITFFPDL